MIRTRQQWWDYCMERGTSGDMVFDILGDWKECHIDPTAHQELLEACKAALRLFEAIAPTSTPQSLVASTGKQLRAAIAKAQGE